MRYTWDPVKAASNERDHRVRFADAVPVFDDVYAVSRDDRSAEGEQRSVTLGMDALGRVLVVVYTYPDDDETRLISARRATRKESL